MEESNINWEKANFRQMFKPPSHIEPAIDELISPIVGRKIYLQDPRVLKLVVKWKADKPPGSMEPDNFLQDPKKVEELKTVLNQSL